MIWIIYILLWVAGGLFANCCLCIKYGYKIKDAPRETWVYSALAGPTVLILLIGDDIGDK
ncbi:MAG: hypothetical protein H8D96_08145 [Desulfobacterales bacterium]|uniref:Uncharacterized protein n=1 Tax=Candidatus Desulfatibia vada TaxID=2841696 RepID=A0A8J6NTF5_9BACT|nr:hypothetical protein [Candidatus Desulfatibia vada]